MNPTCETCRFWMRLSDHDGVFSDGNFRTIAEDTGQCRFNPPTTRGYHAIDEAYPDANSGAAATCAYWPVTWDEHWCGQHQPILHEEDASRALSRATAERYRQMDMPGPPSGHFTKP